jgi:antitoxin component of MazEF toxin-antitoxin module
MASISTKITKIGNSKGIIVPRMIIKSLALEDGDVVELSYDASSQILSAVFPKTKQLKLDVK